MPTYEFTCRDCRHHFDIFTSISGKQSVVCPQCGKKDLQESFGAFYVGGSLSSPSAGTGGGCSGGCASCGGSCKH
jgi:putative FmdB family regulatory protein